ncbi:MAG TPA: TIGR03668 family PPOX class F420-dependent oxidoreductase [Acidimicrobiia bacterium]
MDTDSARELFYSARVARLATMSPRGPHLVPVVFAVIGNRIVSAVDHKAKTTTRLARLANIAADPRVCVLTDHYDDDWNALWWVRADGLARVVDTEQAADAVAALVAKYPQYAERSPVGPVVEVDVTRWSGWHAQQRQGQ